MAAPTVFQDVTEDFALEGVGQLFAGIKFWVAQRVPSRNRFLDDIKANGGEIVALEKKADYRIADHFRRECPPGATSYTFVEKSIKEGRLEDADKHRCGPALGEARQPGALSRPTKSGRNLFTAEEDRILYKHVRDRMQTGGLAGGNVIYEELHQIYPERHTMQSWRNRYRNTLQFRPPSTFNIPDNAPPSPPSDSARDPAPVPSSSRQRKEAKPAVTAPKSTSKTTEGGKPKKKESGGDKVEETEISDYTLEQLAKMFNTKEWEELYAFVDIIEAMSGTDDFNDAWEQWADSQANQTAEQWRQYYHKVVRPQWERDPDWKRKQIKKRVERRHEESDSGESQSESQQPPQDKKPSPGETTKISPEEKNLSSSTARYESPKHISELRQSVLKRARGNRTLEEDEEPVKPSHPPKRQKSSSSAAVTEAEQNELDDTLQRPLHISSSEHSTLVSQSVATQEQTRQDLDETLVNDETMIDDDDEELEKENDNLDLDDLLDSDHVSQHEEDDEPSDDEFPQSSPTPRAAQRRSNFDTQAILSSPSQNIGIGVLPDLTPAQQRRSSSFVPHEDSDASTTQSLQEFRHLTGEAALHHYSRPSPAPSSSSSSSSSSHTSGDPDLPLEAEEIDAYFDEKMAEGFLTGSIVKALKRTRFRPSLADAVLDAWKDGEPLPYQRGIWSVEDDDDVENGDTSTLKELEKKHTLDGWGGITERMIFLEQYRNR